MRRRQREARTAVDAIHGLHERLSERRFAHDIRAIVILQRTCDNLRGARAAPVRDHHDRHGGELAVLSRAVILVRVGNAPARVHDHPALGEELVGDFDGLIEGTAGIAANVEQEPAHAFARQIVQGALEVAVGVLAEILQLDVGRRRIDHECGRDRRDVHLVARHVERDQLLVPAAPQLDVDRRPLGAPQLLHRLFGAPALGVLVADHHLHRIDGARLGQRIDVDRLDPAIGGIVENLRDAGAHHRPADREVDVGAEPRGLDIAVVLRPQQQRAGARFTGTGEGGTGALRVGAQAGANKSCNCNHNRQRAPAEKSADER